MANNWWWALLLFAGLCKGPYFVLAASGDAGDIMFVLDGSGSISADDFVRATNFISQVVGAFDIAADFTRVGVVQFGSQFAEEFPLDQYSDKASLQQAILNIPQRGGGTLLGQVINYLVGTSFTEAKGARPLSEGIPRIAVFMTDGSAQDSPTDLDPAISALRNSGIIVFSIGVGNSVNRNQLEAVTGDSDRVFQVDTYSVIDSIRELLVQRVRVIIESPSSPRPEPPLTRPPTMAPTSTQRRTTQHLMTSRATTQPLMTSRASTQQLMTSRATTQLPMTSSTTQHTMTSSTKIDRCLDVDCGDKKRECVNVPGGYECQCKKAYKELAGKCRGFLTYTVATRMLSHDFYEELYDSNSKEFRKLVQELRQVLRDLYAEGSLTKDEFLDMDIRTFLPGSIIAHYKIFLPDDSPLFLRAGDDVPYILQETLKERAKAHNGTHLLIEHEQGHQVSDYDECASPEDNDCSPFATCQNTVGHFKCACLDGFEDRSTDYDDPPGRVCKEGYKNITTASRLLTRTQQKLLPRTTNNDDD